VENDNQMTMLTIGQLAKRVGLRTSTLRYYEEQGLLTPGERSESGYRLYAPEAEQTLRFIRRAQRLGFSLADIRILLQSREDGRLSNETVVAVAEARFVALERQLTEFLILRHELEWLLIDLRRKIDRADKDPESLFDRLLDRVCGGPPERPVAGSVLDWLIERTNCTLANLDEKTLLDALRGQHIHIWQEDESTHILVVGHAPHVEAALRELAQLEANCHAHAAPQLESNQEGYEFIAQGEHAFIFAQLFLALEQEV
jgi:DNA-binding transcriptional MerR regulator